MPVAYLLIDIFDPGKIVCDEKIVFDETRKFLKYLTGLSSVKEIYRVKASIKQHITDNGSDSLYDREIIIKIEATEREILEDSIKRIKKNPKVKDVDVLKVKS